MSICATSHEITTKLLTFIVPFFVLENGLKRLPSYCGFTTHGSAVCVAREVVKQFEAGTGVCDAGSNIRPAQFLLPGKK